MQVKYSRNSIELVKESELIVRKYRVIEMILFDQYHNDHLQKDLSKKKVIISWRKRIVNLLKIFAWIAPRCPWQWIRNNPRSFKRKRWKHSPDIWMSRGRSTRMGNGEPIKQIIFVYFLFNQTNTFDRLICTWNMNWIKSWFFWKKMNLHKIIINNRCCWWNLTSTKKNNCSNLCIRCWFSMN
jgi:hypothetical protein